MHYSWFAQCMIIFLRGKTLAKKVSKMITVNNVYVQGCMSNIWFNLCRVMYQKIEM